jgi:XTP/dITP diphosphohydrolase
MGAGWRVQVSLLPGIEAIAAFDEAAPTFAENAAGKALHYSRSMAGPVLADDSGLCVEALDGAPGVRSARYGGAEATNAERIARLLKAMSRQSGASRAARFVCVIAMAERGRVAGVFSAAVEGTILEEPRGTGGFGYDPVFFYPGLEKTFAELTQEEKNEVSHRGRAFRKLLEFLWERSATAIP